MMSNENKKKSSRRPYQLKARARRQEEVHKRITVAAIHLHGTVGPAKTTMKAIAEQAGVRRATIYNHFPSEYELLDACSSHWFGENPPPDPAGWAKIDDPKKRVRQGLAEMYDYYYRGRYMLEKVLRDAAVVPAMEEIRRNKWLPMIEYIVGILAQEQNNPEKDKNVRASLRVVLDFFTWRTLIESGLSNEEAAGLAAMWVDSSNRD